MMRITLAALAFLALCTCGADEAASPDAGQVEYNCQDGADNDGDGLVDCEDPECKDDPVCQRPPPRYCESQLDCGNIITEIDTLVCLGEPGQRICSAPGSVGEDQKPLKVDVRFDVQFEGFTTTKPQSLVMRVFLPQTVDGQPLTCDDIKSRAGTNESTRRRLDEDPALNTVYRNLVTLSFGSGKSFSWEKKVSRANPVIVYAEAWWGGPAHGELIPSGALAANACKEGVNLDVDETAVVKFVMRPN